MPHLSPDTGLPPPEHFEWYARHEYFHEKTDAIAAEALERQGVTDVAADTKMHDRVRTAISRVRRALGLGRKSVT